MNKKKALITIGVAGVMAFSVQLMPNVNVGGISWQGTAVAEAGFGGLGDIAKSVGKKAVFKQFNVDIDGMQDKRQNMMLNLYRSALSYAYASAHVQEALGYGDGGAQAKAAIKQLKSDRTNLGSIQSTMKAASVNEKEIAAAAQKLLDSGDEAKIKAANELLSKAKVERRAANIYKVLAARDAVGIVKDTGVALAKGGDSIQDKINVIKDLSAVGKSGEAMAKIIGEQHKGMSNGLKTYEKKQNIKDVSDDEAKKQTNSLIEE